MKSNTAVILAGGKSKRMGFDKNKIEFQGRTMIDHMISLVENIFDEIIIVGNVTDKYIGNISVVKDDINDFGPLGGLYTALKKSKSEYIFLIPCDMPFLSKDYLKYMKSIVDKSDFTKDILMTLYKDDMVEPFCAFYSVKILRAIEGMFGKKIKKVSKLVEVAEVQYISEEKARRYSSDWKMFVNINTIEDLEKYISHKKSV